MFRVGAVLKLLGLLRQLGLRTLVLELLLHLVLDLFEGGRLRRLNVNHLINRISLRQRRGGGRVILLGRKQRAHELRSVADARQQIALRNRTGRCDRQTLFGCGFVHSCRASQCLDGVGEILSLGRSFLAFKDGLDLGLHFVQRLQTRLLLGFDVNDVEAVAGADDVRRLATGVLKAACSNSGTVRPLVSGGSSPPFCALPGSSEYFLASSAKLAPDFNCLSTSSAFLRAASTPA